VVCILHSAASVADCNTLQHTASTATNSKKRIHKYIPAREYVVRTALLLQHTAPHCTTLQHTSKKNFNHYTSISIYPAQRYALCTALLLQHTATHCNTLQHTATHCNTLQQTSGTKNSIVTMYTNTLICSSHSATSATYCTTSHHTIPHCTTLHRTSHENYIITLHPSTVICVLHSAASTTLRHTATHSTTPQHTATHFKKKALYLFTYGVAAINRLLKIIGLLCKRAL